MNSKIFKHENGRWGIEYQGDDGEWGYTDGDPTYATAKEAAAVKARDDEEERRLTASERNYRTGYDYACGYDEGEEAYREHTNPY